MYVVLLPSFQRQSRSPPSTSLYPIHTYFASLFLLENDSFLFVIEHGPFPSLVYNIVQSAVTLAHCKFCPLCGQGFLMPQSCRSLKLAVQNSQVINVGNVANHTSIFLNFMPILAKTSWKIKSCHNFSNQKWKSSELKKSQVSNVARKRSFKSHRYLMLPKRHKLQKTVLNIAKVRRKNSRHLVPRISVPATFSIIIVNLSLLSYWPIFFRKPNHYAPKEKG